MHAAGTNAQGRVSPDPRFTEISEVSVQDQRFTPAQIETWRRDGVTIIHDFFTEAEVGAVRADFETVFGRNAGGDQPMNKKKGEEIGRFNGAQFKGIEVLPFANAPALNLIGLHPALVDFAKAALKTDAVHLYQCQAWAKFTGDADYDQPFHCDFSNHTLTVPSEDAAKNSITILCYFSEVTDAHGAMQYVTRPDSDKITGPEASLDADPEIQTALQTRLRRYERSSASSAGSVVPYSIDVYHRGTNLTAPHAHRYAVMVCFKKAGDESIGFHAWQFHHTKPWAEIFENATPEQLACFGVQRPGDPFWTTTTLARAQTRYPGWDLTPYHTALSQERRTA